jgi:polysaccharide biosynthesis transport protein
MKLFNLSNPQDFMALMVRRKMWILIPFFALSCGALLLTYMLPRMYVSTALVLVQPRDVPDEIIKDALAGSVEQRLTAIKESVLSRTTLLEILREFEGGMPEMQKLDNEQKLAIMRSRTDIELDPAIGSGRAPVTYFRISFRSRNPETAQKIAAKVTAVFIERDNQARETKVDSVTSFVEGELEKISLELDASNTKLKNLRALRRDSLPEQTPANLSNLLRLEERRSTDSAQLQSARTELANIQRFLSETPERIPAAKPITKPILVTPVVKNPLIEEYIAAKNLKASLLADGQKESHPGVMQVTSRLKKLEDQIGQDELAAAMAPKEAKPAPIEPEIEMVKNQTYSQLLAQEATIKNSIQQLEKSIRETELKIDAYDAKVQNAPKTEQELQDVLRENIELTRRFNEMSESVNKAKISQSLESRQQSSPLRIADPANLPLSPTKPSKFAIAGMGIMASLFGGLALAVIVDIANQKMWTMSDVEALLGTTVLVEIPEIVTSSDLDKSRRKRMIYAASIAGLSVVYVACLYFVYLHQGFVLRHLDPFIQRLY